MAQKLLWFEEWFDSPFYHILYGDRDELEARRFIKVLMKALKPAVNAMVLDLACGKGRHARVVHELGYQVTGMDLSTNSIAHAKDFEAEGLSFVVGDMRQRGFPAGTFDIVLNLFTSFGYFEVMDDHVKTLQSIEYQLKPDGILVLDYVNVNKAEKDIELNPGLTKTHQGIDFDIVKAIEDEFITKKIDFRVNNESFHFEERIWRLNQKMFESLLPENGFEIKTIYGDYQLNNFDPLTSDRLIIVAKKA